jgi:hypothetical protein
METLKPRLRHGHACDPGPSTETDAGPSELALRIKRPRAINAVNAEGAAELAYTPGAERGDYNT